MRVNYELPKELVKQVKDHATRTERTMTAVVRLALELYFRGTGDKKQGE